MRSRSWSLTSESTDCGAVSDFGPLSRGQTIESSWAPIDSTDTGFTRFNHVESCNDLVEKFTAEEEEREHREIDLLIETLDAGFHRFDKTESCNDVFAILDLVVEAAEGCFYRFNDVENCNLMKTTDLDISMIIAVLDAGFSRFGQGLAGPAREASVGSEDTCFQSNQLSADASSQSSPWSEGCALSAQ
jgi:hypothetical protein